MLHERYSSRMCRKLEDINIIYSRLMYVKVGEIENPRYFETLEHLRSIPDEPFSPLEKGMEWGGEYMNMWIVGSFTVPEELSGKALWAIPDTGAYETLFFKNGKPDGNYNSKGDYMGIMHSAQKITDNALPGEKIDLAFECYAGHFIVDCHPLNYYGNNTPTPPSYKKRYNSVDICVEDTDISKFVYNLSVVTQMASVLSEDNYLKHRAKETLENVFANIIQYPAHYSRDAVRESARKCNEYLDKLLSVRGANKSRGFAGLIGHSHMDTAWLWTVDETIRKCARTYSNVCKLMDEYPEYTFIQSSALHLWWMKEYYPDIFQNISKYVAEGRYEPNGGVWVECDCNITSGEAMTRQFLYGQRFTRENFGYTSDTFWLPDTFGYNAQVPQIMRECGVKYFCTTKMSWNDLNVFPYSTFTWKGIDGSSVLTHLHRLDINPDVRDIKINIDDTKNSRMFEGRLIPFGHGDGGGGPTPAQLEKARRVLDVEGLPESRYVTVSSFMHEVEEKASLLPVFNGELYLELHRGTLTQMHDIKRTNRKCEIALHNMDYMNVLSGDAKNERAEALWKALLINQFHDILPGTCYTGVTQRAVAENTETIREADKKSLYYASRLLSGDGVTYFNTTSFDRSDCIIEEDTGSYPIGLPVQIYEDISGKKTAIIGGVSIPALSHSSYSVTDTAVCGDSPFVFDGRKLETPFATLVFDENGAISSFYDKTAKRELRRPDGEPLNTFWCGEDVPRSYDNWDIDYEAMLALKPQRELISFEKVSDGECAFVIRLKAKIGYYSEITQDIIFYANTPRVDFMSKIDWKDKHTLLKVGFDVDVVAPTFKCEIQYGHIDRPTSENNDFEIAKFEVCNHKWCDISESRYGVSILNDCKYGISVKGSDMRLTLHKSGTHPDSTGDEGVHYVTYSLLPHNCAFSASSVIAPAYHLNYPPIKAEGKSDGIASPLEIIGADNIICETIKPAESIEGAYVVRLYESERQRTSVKIKIKDGAQFAHLVNMLEDFEKPLTIENGCIDLTFKPFEIKTVLIKQ